MEIFGSLSRVGGRLRSPWLTRDRLQVSCSRRVWGPTPLLPVFQGGLRNAGGLRPGLVWGFRYQGDFFAERPSSIPPIAAGRHDCGESIEVEIDNDLEGFAGGIVT